MKFCTKCGAQLEDDAVYCSRCGAASGEDEQSTTKTYSSSQSSSTKDNALSTVAKIFLILGCLVTGWAIIPLLWTVPLTISYFHKIERNEKISTGFKVVCLLFVCLIAGIAMLFDEEH